MSYTKTFQQINKASVSEAGGKGASLGELTRLFGGQARANPVPPGFVVLATAFDRFLSETGLDADVEAILKKVDHKHINSVDKASAQIRAMILQEKMPKDLVKEIVAAYEKLPAKFVAIRSSATAEDGKAASWAGELETYLNVTQKNLAESVMKCWSSLFTPRAIFYRFEKKQHKKPISVAVVVQEMIQAEVSGICFTVHPVTKDRNQMIIEAGFGLGEAIVGGLITPDSYIIHKDNFSILDVNVSAQNFAIVRSAKATAHKKLSTKSGSRQKLNQKQIIELAKLCKKIEKHYHSPQDIEWAYAKGKFYILQSRPITTL
ncbi:MAG: PEP/pyruvate-binding domain-containing protein [bacterium]|nr:PEP/pyruvate-binding domain-containing protein [bacterium]